MNIYVGNVFLVLSLKLPIRKVSAFKQMPGAEVLHFLFCDVLLNYTVDYNQPW